MSHHSPASSPFERNSSALNTSEPDSSEPNSSVPNLSAPNAPTNWTQQMQLLQRQLQKRLSAMSVTSQLTELDDICLPQTSFSQTSAAITVLSITTSFEVIQPNGNYGKEDHPTASRSRTQWALGVNVTGLSQQVAQQGIVEFWALDTQQVEVSVYRRPAESGYQEHSVFHVGDRISPEAFPNITLEIQEPLPLHFLTRTASGARTYSFTQLPLKLIS